MNNKFGDMNHLDSKHEEAISQQTEISQWQGVISTVVILLVAYYVWPYLRYETTIQRTIYELAESMIPTWFLQLLHRRAARLTGLPPMMMSNDPLNPQGNPQALQQNQESSAISSIVQRARSFSGFDKTITKDVRSTYPGMGNWDNSCFQNSVLQGLASLSAFTEFVDKSRRICADANTEVPTHVALETFLHQLQQQNASRTTLWPPSVLRSMNTWQQQDAQEYFSKIMDATEKEAIKYQNTMAKRLAPSLDCLRRGIRGQDLIGRQEALKDVATDVHRLISSLLPNNPLTGSLSQSLQCQKCAFSEGMSFMAFNCLTLNMGLGGDCYLDDLLEEYTAMEFVEGVECEECTRLANKEVERSREATEQDIQQSMDTETPSEPVKGNQKIFSTKAKQILFGRLPRNLVIHVNRSIFDEWGSQRKNTSLVRFPLTLEILNDWVADIGNSTGELQATYELRCIITHQGRHDNGHYVACGKRGKQWFSFNDEIVTEILEEQVLSRGHVFMLFYEQTDYKAEIEVSTPQKSLTEDECQSPHDHDRQCATKKHNSESVRGVETDNSTDDVTKTSTDASEQQRSLT